MRILITSWPAWGHLYPLFPLARAAQQAGHEVVFASGADVVDGLRRSGFEAWAAGPTREAAGAARPVTTGTGTGTERSPEQQIAADLQELFAPGGVRRAQDLLRLTERRRPELILHEPGDVSGAVVAAVLGIPSVLHGLSVVPPGFDTYIALLASAAEKPFGLTGLADRILGGFALDVTPPSLLLPAYTSLPNRQPLRPSAGEVEPTPEAAALIAALPFERTVYLTLGTIVNNTAGVMETALAGILQRDVNLVVTTGPGFDQRRLGPLPAHVLVREHIGQATVLASASVVVSHAGSGSFLGALRFGLPHLALPMAADQPLNAALLEQIGAGLRLDPSGVTAEDVLASLDRILDEPSFASAAGRVQAEISAMPSASEVVATLEGALVGAP